VFDVDRRLTIDGTIFLWNAETRCGVAAGGAAADAVRSDQWQGREDHLLDPAQRRPRFGHFCGSDFARVAWRSMILMPVKAAAERAGLPCTRNGCDAYGRAVLYRSLPRGYVRSSGMDARCPAVALADRVRNGEELQLTVDLGRQPAGSEADSRPTRYQQSAMSHSFDLCLCDGIRSNGSR